MANTRITQGVIKPNENYVTGVITATAANITGSLNIGAGGAPASQADVVALAIALG